MQQAQFNYRALGIGAALLVALVFAGKSAFSEGLSDRGKPDSILNDKMSGPCAPELGQANLASGPIPLRGQIEVPLKAQRGRAPAYVAVDGAKLDPLLNPKSSCQ